MGISDRPIGHGHISGKGPLISFTLYKVQTISPGPASFRFFAGATIRISLLVGNTERLFRT